MFQLRPYQAEAKQAILAAWDEGYRKTLLVLPTGCGKTVVFSSVTEDQVKKTGCSVIYCHHHSKGSQGMKRAMDRASGSGVFARDPDAQLDMIELELTDDIKNNVRDGNATAWRLESSLREFPNITPINFWFEYPIHRVDVGGILGGMPAQGTPKAGKLNNPKSKSSDEAADEFRTAYDALNMDGKVTVADLADYLGISDKTVYSRLKKMDGEYLLEKGAIRRSAPAQ